MTAYLKPQDVADLLGVNARTVKRWIARGKLQAIKTPGGHYRIPMQPALAGKVLDSISEPLK